MKKLQLWLLALFVLLAVPAFAVEPLPLSTPRQQTMQPRQQITETSVNPGVLGVPVTSPQKVVSVPIQQKRLVIPPTQPSPTPTPGPAVKEPTDSQQALQLALVLVQLVKAAVRLGTLAAIAVVALAATYLLMYLIKTTLKGAIPENYKKLLNAALAILTVVAGLLGYFAAGGGSVGLLAALAAALGAAFSGPTHRIIDGVAGLKKTG